MCDPGPTHIARTSSTLETFTTQMSTTPKRALVISSEGPLDIAAITLMGLSTKRDDREKIGMFGTGLKYSIAKLLRDKIPFKLWNGEREVSITSQPGNFRGRNYEQVIVDGVATSITTDMGPQWETWWIIRELLSNARDESVHEFYVRPWDEVDFPAGWTVFALDYDTFEAVWLNREKYFVIDRLPRHEVGPLKLYTRLGDGCRIYKNGVLIHEDDADDAFDYDMSTVELNEMREIRYTTLLRGEITTVLLTDLDDANIVREYVNKINTHMRYFKPVYTGDVSTYDQMNLELSDAWKEVINGADQPFHKKEGLSGDLPTDGLVVPSGLYGVIHAFTHKDKPLQLSAPTPAQEEQLQRVLGKLFDYGVKIRYPIKTAELGPHVHGQRVDSTIVLNPSKAFGDDKNLASILLEEFLHIATGQADMTRSFQTAIFDTWAGCVINGGTPVVPSPVDLDL